MNSLEIFGLQLALSVLSFALLAKWYLAPWLANKSDHDALILLTLPHISRHVGMAFLVPGLVAPGIPESFAVAAAYGDLVSGLLALLVVFALRERWRVALPLLALFNVVGAADLFYALSWATAVPYLHTTWYIPTFWVPLLLVTHGMIFIRLFQPARKGWEAKTPLPQPTLGYSSR